MLFRLRRQGVESHCSSTRYVKRKLSVIFRQGALQLFLGGLVMGCGAQDDNRRAVL